MIVKGWGGSFELLDDCLVIRRTYVLGLLQHGLKGDKRIPYSSITAVQFKRPGVLNGYIQFTIAGGVENTAGIIASASDENSLQFVNGEAFDRAKDFIEKKLADRAKPVTVPMAAQSPAEQLDKLAGLLDRGLLTKEEFEDQKRVLLGKVLKQETQVPIASPQQEPAPSPALARAMDAMDRAISEHQSRSSIAAVSRSFGRRQVTH